MPTLCVLSGQYVLCLYILGASNCRDEKKKMKVLNLHNNFLSSFSRKQKLFMYNTGSQTFSAHGASFKLIFPQNALAIHCNQKPMLWYLSHCIAEVIKVNKTGVSTKVFNFFVNFREERLGIYRFFLNKVLLSILHILRYSVTF